MPHRLLAHRVRIYPSAEQSEQARHFFGCTRFLYNLGLEQRSTYGRPGRRISYQSWSAELKALKAEAPWLAEAPHHCLQQALRDLDGAFAKFFAGTHGYPKPRRKYQNDSFRFPDPKQFEVGKDWIKLPKLGKVAARIHRPIQGQLRSITVSREDEHYYASILVKAHVAAPKPRPMVEGGIDLGVAQPIAESDGTVHHLPLLSVGEQRRKARLHRNLSRKKKGSANRRKAMAALRRFEARTARRRRDAAQQATTRLARKYTHLAVEGLKVRNMTASAAGTKEKPGKKVRQKSGLNRVLLDLAPGQIRRLLTYKSSWRGTVLTAVNPARTSQTCGECLRHPADDPSTAHLPHGRISRDRFVCPLCGHEDDADVNAARVVLARGRQHWAANDTTAGPAVAACGGLSAKDAREAGKKISRPRRPPPAA